MNDRDAAIIQRVQSGAKLADVGAEFGISRQRVHQIVVKADKPVSAMVETCGMCGARYRRRELSAHRRSDRHLAANRLRRREEAVANFWARVDKSGDCWVWMGSRYPTGYGHINAPLVSDNVGAHRVAYELSVGPIPEGMTIDHLCVNPPCCNPQHMEVVSQSENSRRVHRRRRAAA